MAELPFLATGRADLGGVQQDRQQAPRIQQAEHQGVKVLALFTHGPGIVFNTKRPITKSKTSAA
jgi:TRAP-type C4-dicarboxylate transport system substrate-binding protein